MIASTTVRHLRPVYGVWNMRQNDQHVVHGFGPGVTSQERQDIPPHPARLPGQQIGQRAGHFRQHLSPCPSVPADLRGG
jgi:hypothetical protein